jgi:putative ATP-binding cassette transporter
MVLFVALYMASISLVAFLLTAALIAAGLSIYLVNSRQVKVHLRDAGEKRLRFFDGITDLLRGAKEVKFNRRRGEELYEDIHGVARELRGSTERAHRMLDDNSLFAQSNFFLLLGAVVFVAPQFHQMASQSTASLIAGIIFIMGPLSSVILGIPAFTRANLAAENIASLEARLEEAGAGALPPQAQDPWPAAAPVSAITCESLVYRYRTGAINTQGEGFQIGPIDLQVAAGEVLFIVGGNGSGKSTLLKVLTSLYPASAGTLSMDGITVTPRTAQAFRERFSVIFGDFHLFRRLYGLQDVDDGRLRELLEAMQLAGKTALVDGRFSSLELSTGQRKRLAMVVALLEDRPVYAFDEWAADQDPGFRRHFYREMLPDLQRRGKTVIVVTHDDQYFDCADRVVVMEYGRIRSVQPGRVAADA